MDELRLECLRLAHQPEMPAATVVERAKAYHDFLIGNSGLPPVEPSQIEEIASRAQPLSAKVFDRETRGTLRDPKNPQESK